MLGLAAITASSLFLAVGTANAAPVSASNPAKITITDAGALNGSAPAKATPYPSDIAITGVTGQISKLTVALNNLNHTCSTDVDAILVAPDGLHKSVLMSDAGDCPGGATQPIPGSNPFTDDGNLLAGGQSPNPKCDVSDVPPGP